jgi:hypothetical protein
MNNFIELALKAHIGLERERGLSRREGIPIDPTFKIKIWGTKTEEVRTIYSSVC